MNDLMEKHNILVIGGSYFAGRVFVEVARGYPEYDLHVFNRGRIPLGMDGVEAYVGDRDNPDQIAKAIADKPWRAVVDFCAYEPEQITLMLGKIGQRVKHYILISTTSVYAPGGFSFLDETAPILNQPLPELGAFADYAFNKVLAEEILKMECLQRGIPFTIFRPAIIYGRYNYAPRESVYFDRIRRKQPIVIPDPAPARFSFVWVEDLARILVASIQAPGTFDDTFNIAGPEAISYSDMADALQRITSEQIRFHRKPMAEIARENIELPFPPDTDLLYDGRKIGRAIGFQYTPFQVGMAETWRHYMASTPALNS